MSATVARERLAVAFDALRGAEAAHERRHKPDRPEALADGLATLERELRDAAHAFEVLHSERGHPLDRLAAQVVTDAVAGTIDARLRLRGMSTSDGLRADPARLALRAATHALELAEYVANIEGTGE